MPPRACIIGNKDGSGHAVPGTSRCKAHTNSNWARSKHPYSKVYKDAQWVNLRKRVLREEPICAEDGCTAPSTSVDHIVSLANGGDPFDRRNLRGMCEPHHRRRSSQQGAEARKKAREESEKSHDL